MGNFVVVLLLYNGFTIKEDGLPFNRNCLVDVFINEQLKQPSIVVAPACFLF